MSKKMYYTVECLGSDPSQATALANFAENILGLKVVELTAVINDKVIKLSDCEKEA